MQVKNITQAQVHRIPQVIDIPFYPNFTWIEVMQQ
jgi:hypothetical protein